MEMQQPEHVDPSGFLKPPGEWNTLEITARGTRLTVRLNGVQTVDAHDARLAAGPIALQFGPGPNGARGGPIRWRKVQVRDLQPPGTSR